VLHKLIVVLKGSGTNWILNALYIHPPATLKIQLNLKVPLGSWQQLVRRRRLDVEGLFRLTYRRCWEQLDLPLSLDWDHRVGEVSRFCDVKKTPLHREDHVWRGRDGMPFHPGAISGRRQKDAQAIHLILATTRRRRRRRGKCWKSSPYTLFGEILVACSRQIRTLPRINKYITYFMTISSRRGGKNEVFKRNKRSYSPLDRKCADDGILKFRYIIRQVTLHAGISITFAVHRKSSQLFSFVVALDKSRAAAAIHGRPMSSSLALAHNNCWWHPHPPPSHELQRRDENEARSRNNCLSPTRSSCALWIPQILTPLGKRSLKVQIGPVFDQIAQSMRRCCPVTNDFEMLSQALQCPFPHGQRLIQPRHDDPAAASHFFFLFCFISFFIFISFASLFGCVETSMFVSQRGAFVLPQNVYDPDCYTYRAVTGAE